MVTEIAGLGTSEEAWSGWAGPAGWPTLAPPARPLIVAPHPDDEVLGAGGLLCLAGGGEVVAVTDGEASHAGSTVYAPDELVALRRAETAAALSVLGQPATPVRHLGHPDGDIDEAALTATLTGLLSPGRWCVATWRGDGHPDHETVGRAAAAACAATGAILAEYPIWMWHWADPGDPRVPWHRARRLDLPAAVCRGKAAAVAEFRSQTEPLGPAPADAPILPPHVVARFLRPYEVFLT
ncbi:PIG-L deacetylase family protein [Plantactinospora siamensis]|uniref:PIG-L deacetylase family protein n=1 Tax=Plantactinospora siamensis TaxID=555372 RepID=A0ABV6P3S6_9ACTN